MLDLYIGMQMARKASEAQFAHDDHDLPERRRRMRRTLLRLPPLRRDVRADGTERPAAPVGRVDAC